MTNMPISSKSPLPAGSANAQPANILAESLAMEMQPSEPFAFLLARQIGEDGISVQDIAQAAMTIDENATNSADPSRNDAQDNMLATANMDDPAGLLAAIMVQIPATGDKGQMPEGKDDMLAASLPQKTDARQTMQLLALGTSRKTGDSQAAQPPTLNPAQENEHRKNMAIPGDNQTTPIPAAHQAPDTAKRQEILPLQAQSPQSAAQTIASSAIPATMPGAPANIMSSAEAQPTIATPLNSHAWADEFSQKINWISTQNHQVAELRLNPPNLGPLDVVLRISDNQATALFASPHGAVRDAVENALPKLREVLADNGIMLGNTTISDQSPRDRSMDGFMNQGFGAATRQETSGIALESAGVASADVPTTVVRRHNGMVDTFA